MTDPARGLIGFRGEFLTSTRGTGLLTTMFDGWEPWGGMMAKRQLGAIVSDRQGVSTPYAMNHLQARGIFFIKPGAEVYVLATIVDWVSVVPKEIGVMAAPRKGFWMSTADLVK